MSVVSSVRDQIEQRLSELDWEGNQLRQILAVIDNGSPPAEKSDEIAAIINTPARGESRKAQIRGLLSAGIKPADIAQQLECAPAYVYSVRRGMST